jgi:hypothetical protein
MTFVTFRWLRLLASREPAIRLEPEGAWIPSVGKIGWLRIRDVRFRDGAVHLVPGPSGSTSPHETSPGRNLMAWRNRDETVVPVLIGSRASEVAAIIRQHAGLPAVPARPSMERAFTRVRVVNAIIVGTLGATADAVFHDVSSPVIWLTGVVLFVLLEWLTGRFLLRGTEPRAPG